ncbi:MAG: hypothetical protein ABSB10_05455 [Candidatus Bathyarchaeia archaeon]|jgi:hypothetical protein
MTAPSPQKQNYAKPVVIIIAAIVIAIIIIAVVLSVAVPAVQQAVNPTPVPTPVPAAVFTFTSQSSNRQTVGGFLGIGGNVVVWVDATVENTGNAAGGCTVYAQVTDANGAFWTQSQGIYLGVGASQSVALEFTSGPHNDAYTYNVYTG